MMVQTLPLTNHCWADFGAYVAMNGHRLVVQSLSYKLMVKVNATESDVALLLFRTFLVVDYSPEELTCWHLNGAYQRRNCDS